MDDGSDDDLLPTGLRSRPKTLLLYATVAILTLAALALIVLPLVFIGHDATRDRPAELAVETAIHGRLSDELRLTASQTVAIQATAHRKDDQAFGTGFLIRDGLVISAAHIANPARGRPISVYCGRRVDGVLLAHDVVRDVMVIRARGCAAATVSLEELELDIDDELHAAGFTFPASPEDDRRTAKRFYGRTSPIPQAILDPDVVERSGFDGVDLADRLRLQRALGIPRLQAIAGEAIPGQSGSPVFMGDGTIVGMIVIGDVAHNRSYMVPAASIIQMLRDSGIE